MTVHGFRVYWLCWLLVTFTSFIVPEIIGLVRNWQFTLSAAVWNLEKFQPGEPLSRWTAFHFLFIGMLLVTFIWLLLHFAMGWWR